MNLLLLSNSTNVGAGYLAHALPTVLEFLDGARLTFVPYALADHDGYTATVRGALEPHGIDVRGLSSFADPVAAIAEAEAVFVGGGNTFRLLQALQQRGLLDVLGARVREGLRYMGASAGTNLAGLTIRTTNDMPIVQPDGFAALGLLPLQINPHYLDADPASRHGGETREQRLTEFLEANDVAVLGLREGVWLRVTDGRAAIGGVAVGAAAPGPAIVYSRGGIREVAGDVTDLLSQTPRFDVPLGG